MVLAAATLASGCASTAWPEAPPQARAPDEALRPWWRACRRPALDPGEVLATSDVAANPRRADLDTARQRLDAAARQLPPWDAAVREPGFGLGSLLGLTTRGLNNLVRAGSDMGQANLGVWPEGEAAVAARRARSDYEVAQAAYRRTLALACRDAAQAAAAAAALQARATQAGASLADAEAASQALRRADGPKADGDPAVALAEREVAIRRKRFDQLEGLRVAARRNLARALGDGPETSAAEGAM